MFQGWQGLLRENDDAPDDDDDYGSHDSRGAGIGKPGNPTGLPKFDSTIHVHFLKILPSKFMSGNILLWPSVIAIEEAPISYFGT